MNKWFCIASCCLTSFLLATPAAAQLGVRWQREAQQYGWLTDYRAAVDQAKRTNRPLMVVFRCVP